MLRPPIDETPRFPWRAPLAVLLVAGALVVWRRLAGGDPDPTPPAPTASSSAEPAPAPSAPPRCTEAPGEPFIIGDAPAAPKATPPDPSAGLPGEPPEDPEDPAAPFAVEVGRGAVFAGGFAVGARRDEKTGAVGMVATLGLDGKGGQLVRLGRLRGDLDPPVVAGAGNAVVAVMVEPNAGNPATGGGRSLRVAKVDAGQVTWGPELSEGRDESQALDVASSPSRALVVWDDLVGTTAKHSAIMLAAVDVATMKLALPARPVSPESEDAEHPRLVARPGGYWLAYVVRGGDDPKKKPKSDGEDDRELGETIPPSRIHLVPIDESGAPAGTGRAITPKGGHVLAYDLESGDDGGALVAWRDDDTPTGSVGGRLMVTLARLGGVSDPIVLAEETSAAGVPDLLPGWITLPSVNGSTRIGALSPRGDLLDDLAPEKSLGAGVPIAATKDAILWARPMGKPVRLSVVQCKPRPAEPGDAGKPSP